MSGLARLEALVRRLDGRSVILILTPWGEVQVRAGSELYAGASLEAVLAQLPEPRVAWPFEEVHADALDALQKIGNREPEPELVREGARSYVPGSGRRRPLEGPHEHDPLPIGEDLLADRRLYSCTCGAVGTLAGDDLLDQKSRELTPRMVEALIRWDR